MISITEPLKEHLFNMKDEFYFAYHNNELVSKQIYHYFCSPYQYYKQYGNHSLDQFQISIEDINDEIVLKSLEIGLITSTFYLMFQDAPNFSREKYRCNQLEKLNIAKVIQLFYQNPSFAKDMILGFVQSDFYDKDEFDQKREIIKQSGKEHVLFSLYPMDPLDQAIYEYNKNKTYRKEN